MDKPVPEIDPITAATGGLTEMRVVLMIDAMYLNEAERAFVSAVNGSRAIQKAMQKVERLNRRRECILEKHDGKSLAAYDDLEPICVQLEAAEHDLGVAHAPVLQKIAIVHLLAAASLEAHINLRGIERLSGKHFELFEKFSLEAKWVTFPKLLGLTGFDIGAQPFQGFSRLVKLRNALAHYKAKQEDWTPPGVPSVLPELGLTQDDAEKSIRAAKGMMKNLSGQLGESEPFWLRRSGKTSYFGVKFK